MSEPLNFEAETVSRHDSTPGSRRLEVRCPSCHVPMEVAVDTQLTDLTCPSCGSHFSLVDQSMATRMAPSLTKLGRFELIERLGIGGCGSVWKARDKELDRTVAIKIPRADAMTGEEQEKFFREARAAAQLRHPGIVSVHEVGRDGDAVYIVSDFVRGVTLGDWLTGQQLTSRETAELCAKIADALHHAHEHGVVHRDLKPANIIMNYDGQPHIMDFGLARRETGEVTMTIDGHVLGTPAYMPPEQAEGKAHQADRRSDVYSLGVILFQSLTGELPFRGNARMLIKQVIQDEAPSPRKLNGNVPKDLETITLKCLEKEPARRYQSARELAAELRRHLNDEPIHARPISHLAHAWRWGKRNPMIGTTAVLVVLLAIAGPIIAIQERQRNRLQSFLGEKDVLITRYSKDLTEQSQSLTEQSKDIRFLDSLNNVKIRRMVVTTLFDASKLGLAKGLSDREYSEEEIGRGYLGLAILANAADDKTAAIEFFQLAREQLRKLAERNPQSSEFARALAQCNVQIARHSQDRSEVAKCLANAATIYRRLAANRPADKKRILDEIQVELALAVLAGYESGKEHLVRVEELSRELRNAFDVDPTSVYQLACYLTGIEAIMSKDVQTKQSGPSTSNVPSKNTGKALGQK